MISPMYWLPRFRENQKAAGPFGPLELRVLEALWDRDHLCSVRDLQPAFPEIAYTTLMTTLDRLHRKGVLDRSKRGRAFCYKPSLTRAQLESARAAEALRVALQGDGASVSPLLSFFVDVVGNRDRELLDELESLIRTRRAELERKQS
jgi:predicted transcriptional regulator